MGVNAAIFINTLCLRRTFFCTLCVCVCVCVSVCVRVCVWVGGGGGGKYGDR